VNLTVIIPNYNGAQYLEQTLRSVSEDLCNSDQIIIIDDCSTDNSIGQIQKFIKTKKIEIKLVNLPKNSGGPAYPRNIGIKFAENDIICFFDNDDIWLKGRRNIIMDIFNETNADAVFTNIHDNTKIYPSYIEGNKGYRYLSRFRIALLNELKLSTSAIRKNILEGVGFCEEGNFVAVEDFDLWMTLSKKYLFVKSDLKTVWYRRHTHNISKNKLRQAFKVMQVYKKHSKMWPFYFMTYAVRGCVNAIILFLKSKC
jgi:teichuronic acid biosynthesis glycosyltransferase TuaG